MKKIKVIAILLALAIIFNGCSMVEVNEERDRETVVAKVGDAEILKGDIIDQIEMYTNYGYFPEDFATDPDYTEMYQEQVRGMIDAMIDSELENIMAVEKGCYQFTAEEREELDSNIEEILNTYIGLYAAELKQQDEFAEMSEDELGAYAYEHLDEYFEAGNFGVTKQDIIDDVENSKAKELLYEMTTKSIVVTEDEVKADYDAKVDERKTAYEEGSALFEQDANGGETLYYIPEGARQAQHILIALSDEAKEEVSALRQSADDDGADAKLAEVLVDIEDSANAAYERAAAGEDFVALIDELGEDSGMDSNDYYVLLNPSYYFVSEFSDGLFALENVGDISEPVASDFGYHIIKYYGELQSGAVPYDELHDDIYETMLDERKSAAYEEAIIEWRESADIKTYYNRAY